MVVRLHPEALAEFTEAIAFYDERAPGLGRDFFDEVQRLLRAISANPDLGATFHPPYRRLLCRRFPFSIVYRVGSDEVVVQAVMHHRRQPGYWKARSEN